MRRLFIPDEINARLDGLGLGRIGRTMLVTALLTDACRRYDEFSMARAGPEGRYFSYPTSFRVGAVLHRFVIWLDDSTAQGHNLVADFAHRADQLSDE